MALADDRDARATTFGQFQFLEEFADPAIAVAPGDDLVAVEGLDPNRGVRAGIAYDLDPVGIDADFHRLTLFVAAVVDGVDQCLLNGCKRVVEDPGGFGPVLLLDDLLADDVVLDVSQGVADLLVDGSTEGLLDQFCAGGSLGEYHDIDLGARQEPLGRLVEEQDADVAGLDEFVAPLDDVHLPRELHERHLRRLSIQAAADFLQVCLDERQSQVFHARNLTEPVVEGDRGREAEQFSLVVASGFDRAGVAADVVVVDPVLGGDLLGSLVRSVLAAGCPQHDEVLAFDRFDTEDGEIGRLDQIAGSEEFLLDLVQLVVGHTDGREDRLTVLIAVLADDDVAAAQVLEIVGEGRARIVASGFQPALYSMRSRSTVRCRSTSSRLMGSLLGMCGDRWREGCGVISYRTPKRTVKIP